MNIVIPMAGLATRFLNEGITTIKPLIVVNGKTLIEHTLETLGLEGHYIFITRTYDKPEDNAALSETLQRLRPGSTEIRLEHPTRGAVETCLAARDLIDTSVPLIITNCDQRTEWDSAVFLQHLMKVAPHGSVVTHDSSEPKHSYAEVAQDGTVLSIREKQVISKHALVGIHYWARGWDFVASAEALMESFAKEGRKECYISETYNHLIGMGRCITTFQVGPNEYIPLGTPYDVAIYEARVKEYQTEKPKTLFIDLDGTILQHLHRFSDLGQHPPVLLKGVRDKINQWDSVGHRIILCTARKESARAFTERQLEALGVPYDQLLMGLTSGPRVLVNDKLTEAAPDRALAVNLPTNAGFDGVNWKGLGL